MVSARPTAWFLLACLVFLHLNLFVQLHIPIFLAEDPQIYPLNATRMAEGQVIYRDFFQLTPPGAELVYVVLFKLFGARVWIPNALAAVLGLALAWLTLTISRRALSGPTVFLPSLLFLTLAFRIWFSGSTHNWFSLLAVIAAVVLVAEKRTPARLIGAGALCGLASFFTQTRGLAAVLGFAVFLLWERSRKAQRRRGLLENQVYLFGAFLATIGALDVYFIQKAGLGRFLYCTVVFVARHFPSDWMYNSLNAYVADLPELLDTGPWVTYRLPGLAIWLFVHALFPFVYLAFFMRYRREAGIRSQEPWEQLMLLSVIGSFLLIAVAPAPSWFRLCSVSPPALMVLVWLVRSTGRLGRVLARSLAAVALILVIAEPLERQINWCGSLDLPRGRTAFLDCDVRDKFRWLLQRTRPSEFFFRGIFPDYYFALDLRNPAEVLYITATDFTRPEQVRNVVEALERRRVRFVFWSVWLDVPGGDRSQGDHLGPLRSYLRDHYHTVKIFPDADYEQAWERNR